MDERAAKLALARQKLRNHQEKKLYENISNKELKQTILPDSLPQPNEHTEDVSLVTVPQLEEGNNNTNKHTVVDQQTDSNYNKEIELNATEILISNKRDLEMQVNSLQAKLLDLENNLMITTQYHDLSCQKIINLEKDLKNINYKYQAAVEQLMSKDEALKELSESKFSLTDQKSNLQEQLEFTKSMLKSKEAENDSLHSQLYNVQNQLDAALLQLQQLTNGALTHLSDDKTDNKLKFEVLTQKVSTLEQQLKMQVKDNQQLNNHYEHYVGELNNQLQVVTKKNEELTRELQNLSHREISLIEQIGDMEIRLQNYNRSSNVIPDQSVNNTSELDKVKENLEKTQQNLQALSNKYEELQKLYAESKAEIENLIQSKELSETEECSENVSLLKLNADITSDKIAAQRATEQNKKLKQDIQGLEDAFVKMTKDKLELTEKITAEKFLNRELTIKLAEIDEKSNNLQKKIRAKDEEMIRLQTSYRVLEQKYNEIAENLKHLEGSTDLQDQVSNHENEQDAVGDEETNALENPCHGKCTGHASADENENMENNTTIPKTDAMVKLQERFLKIMDEVADLSDEKHRLEHIITQLQNETDTICEYVALYQQQRCLLKKRDEERTTQMKVFQSECTRLQSQLDELSGILTKFAEDKALSSYFQVQTKHEDIQKVMNLLLKLKTNSLIDPQKSVKFNDCYPCSCCSGQLIEV